MLRDTLRVISSLPRQVRFLLVGMLVNRMGSFILPYLSLVLVREFRLDADQAAHLVGAFGLGSLLSILMGGVFTDRLGRRRTLLISLLGAGSLAVGMGLAPTVEVFLPLLFSFAFLADLYRPASSAMISDLLPSEQRAGGFAALRVAVNLGFACGMGLGGLLVDWNWRTMFVADGLSTLAFGGVVFGAIAESRPAPAAEAAAVPGASTPWRDVPFLLTMACMLGFALLVFSDFTVFPLTVTLSAGYPASVFGLLVGLNGILITLFEVGATTRLARHRRLRVAAVGLLVGGVGLGITGVFLHWSWFLVSVLLWTAGEILVVPQVSAFAADWAPPAARGRYLAAMSGTWSLALALNPLLFLPLHARLGDTAFWPLLFLLAVPGAIGLWRLDQVVDRPERLRGRTTDRAAAA